jgi:hypothetical protein
VRIAIMRGLDRWVGVPLVAMLVGLHRLWWLIARPRKPGTIERIAFLGLSELGSTIIADPAVRRARELFPGAELYFVIFAGNRDSLTMLGTIDPQSVLAIREDSFHPLRRRQCRSGPGAATRTDRHRRRPRAVLALHEHSVAAIWRPYSQRISPISQ